MEEQYPPPLQQRVGRSYGNLSESNFCVGSSLVNSCIRPEVDDWTKLVGLVLEIHKNLVYNLEIQD